MSASSSLVSSATFTTLQNYHSQYWGESKFFIASSASAVFFIVTSTIVIVSACICLILPGINVVSSVILPAVFPGIIGIAIGSVLMYVAFRYYKKMEPILNNWINEIKTNLEAAPDAKKTRVKVLINLLSTESKSDNTFKQHLLTTLKKTYPKNIIDQTDTQKELLKAIDKATTEITKEKKKKH